MRHTDLRTRTPKPAVWGHGRKRRDRLERLLSHRGFTKIGSGAYASVWAKAGYADVLKVGYDGRYDDGTAGYLDYLTWANTRRRPSSWMPRASKVVEGHGWFCVRLERLQDVDADTYADLDGVMQLGDGYHRVSRKRLRNETARKAIHTVRKQFRRASFDTHRGNFMMRSNGQLVLTDPIA